ncbi:RagB/SusD family nutrient uptake outer membrane protein [Mucilaginibacter ximonensis]|uniref:RagB/SusD family nutrient uptake outer membrane protein n=1 Tax=Mucilaginibacter ximonensis TaxID=538021 RepID=A0ABW5Y9D8_9SPHI
MKIAIFNTNKGKGLRLLVSLFLTATLISCNKYLDVQPKGSRLLKTVNDYNLWLNNYALEAEMPRELNLLSDLVDNVTIPSPPVDAIDRVYSWQDQFDQKVTGTAYIWYNYYQSIYLFNAVIYNIDGAENGTAQQKNALKAEALLGRALDYLSLVNLYGKQYNAATADKDLAVPFVTTLDISDKLPNRSTVKEIYGHIIADINEALTNLPADNKSNRYRGSVAAAYSVLARTYLYMGDYQKAADNAGKALSSGQFTITDYSTLAPYAQLPAMIRSTSEIYARQSSTYYLQEIPTLDFLKSFDKNDLRLKLWYDQSSDPNFTQRGKTVYYPYGNLVGNGYPDWGTSAAEMYLIIAEAAARANNLPLALDQLDIVRKKRFLPANYVKYQSTNQDDVLKRVLAERTFEFPYNGLRWFDMKRLAAENRMPEVDRYDASGQKIASLPPNSTKYTLQIPAQVMYFNANWQQNP